VTDGALAGPEPAALVSVGDLAGRTAMGTNVTDGDSRPRPTRPTAGVGEVRRRTVSGNVADPRHHVGYASRMRSDLVAVLLGSSLVSVLSACGKTGAPAPAVVSASASASASGAPAAVKVEAVLPTAAALFASIDLTKVAQPGVLDLLGPNKEAIEKQLGLAPGVSGAALVAALGVDPSRPITLAQFVLGEEGKTAIADLRPIIPHAVPIAHGQPGEVQPKGVYEPVTKALASIPALASYRVLIPAKDVAKVKDALDKFMKTLGLTPAGQGTYASHHLLATVGVAGDTVVVDLVGSYGGTDGLRALRAQAAGGHGQPPPLAGGAFAIRYVPERQAELGFLSETMTTAAAVSGASINPEMRERIMNEGLWEASRTFAAATSAKGARFTQIDVTANLNAGHARATMRAEPGPGYDGPGDDAWGPTFAISSAAAPGSAFDLSRSFVDGWKIPGDESRTALDLKAFMRPVHDAGRSGLVISLPALVGVLPQAIDKEALAPGAVVLAHFARFGVLPVAAPAGAKGAAPAPAAQVFLGVLPDGASKAVAECALAEASPCGAHKLTLGSVTKDGGAWARLERVEKHYVVLRASKKETLTSALVKGLKGGTKGPVEFVLDVGSMLGPDLGGIAASMTGTVKRDGKTLVAELASP
jgi:hypothetical protein